MPLRPKIRYTASSTVVHLNCETLRTHGMTALRRGRGAGLTPDQWFARNAGMVPIDTDPAVDLDDEAREAARRQAEAERAEAEKRERRKSWHSTSSVMRR